MKTTQHHDHMPYWAPEHGYHLDKTGDVRCVCKYVFNVFRLIQPRGVSSYSSRSSDQRDIVKLCQVSAFTTAADGWIRGDLCW